MKQVVVFTCLLHVIVISLCSEVTHKHSNTTYDQRQVGKYNIHFNIKDVAIIALSTEDIAGGIGDSDSYADYYDYEDSELTVSPVTADLTGRPTTKKPNITHPLQPSIDGLDISNLSSTPTSTSTDSNPSDSLTTKIPQTVVVIHEKPSTPKANSAESVASSTVKYQPNEIPVQVIVEPLLKPKVRQPQFIKRKSTNRQANINQNEDNEEVRIKPRRSVIGERNRLRRAQAQAQNRILRNNNNEGCNRGEIRDGQGGCRTRRSGMSGLLGFLTKFLPQGDRE